MFAQPIVEHFDINKKTDSKPTSFTAFNNKLYFYANDSISGQELWVTDGAAIPAFSIVKDIHPSDSDRVHTVSRVNHLAVTADNKLFFIANDGRGREMWIYDGVNPAHRSFDPDTAVGSNLYLLAALNNHLYYAATTSTGREVYEYNIAADSAIPVTSLSPASSNISYIGMGVVAFNGKIYFSAHADATGQELYVHTPGTFGATVIDISPGSHSSHPTNLYVFNNKLYFYADLPNIGFELWEYDGVNSPVRLTDLGPGLTGGFIHTTVDCMLGYKGKLYFTSRTDSTGTELFVYDPATAQARLFQNLAPGNIPSLPEFLTEYRGRLYFAGGDGNGTSQLWRYDGINIPERITVSNYWAAVPYALSVFNDKLYFGAADSVTGFQLFRLTDTSAIKPISVAKYINPVAISLHPNPAHDAATLEISLRQRQTLEVILTDAQGRTVHTIPSTLYHAGTQRITLPIASLPAGMYYYRISNGSTLLASGKVVKE
jgi:ELWxxDGT repeat protein